MFDCTCQIVIYIGGVFSRFKIGSRELIFHFETLFQRGGFNLRHEGDVMERIEIMNITTSVVDLSRTNGMLVHQLYTKKGVVRYIPYKLVFSWFINTI